MARVLLFGRLGDVAGWREKSVSAASLDHLRRVLGQGDRALGEALGAPGVHAAVDRQIVRGDVALTPHAEVAFMPPMSGG